MLPQVVYWPFRNYFYSTRICRQFLSQKGQIDEAVCGGCACDQCSPCKNRLDQEKIPTCETVVDHATSHGGTIDKIVIDGGIGD